MIEKIKSLCSKVKTGVVNWWGTLTTPHKIWVTVFPLAILALGLFSGDTAINILIGVVGAIYVGVYATANRWSFLLGIAYVSLYTVICLQNRIMLDALQNIILIPLYAYSFIYWGKKKIQPWNLTKKNTLWTILSAVAVFGLLYALSKLLNGNYSALDALNTTCTLYAMVLGMWGISLNWALWTVNNVASALTFGLALFTPTGSITVFAMKVAFMINGLIGWYCFYKKGKNKEIAATTANTIETTEKKEGK